MNNFIFTYPTKVYFGKGCVKEYLACLLKKQGPTVMLAYGGGSVKKNGVYGQMMDILAQEGKTVVEFGGIMPNPTYAKVQEGAKLCRENHVDFILAVGGGSVIDCCKIVSAQAMLDEDIWEMEFFKRQYPEAYIPMGAVVTASGTGSEMNNGAVITHEEKKLKAGVLGAYNTFAMLDPEYTMTVPFPRVMSGAFDTLSHAMETYFGKPHECNNLSDDISEAVSRAVKALVVVVSQDPKNDKTNYGDLARYIRYNNNCEIIESAVFSVIEEILREETFQKVGCAIHVSWVTLVKDYALLNEEEKIYAQNPLTHVDFLLFNQMDKAPIMAIEVDGTSFHRAGSKQAKRDARKDSIFQKCGIPLLRIRTDESGEERRIESALKASI